MIGRIKRTKKEKLKWLLSKTKTVNECLEWQGCLHPTGYSMVWHDGKSDRGHRVMYCLTKGPIPKPMVVMHSCDNRKCINPKHLVLGTQQINMQDCANKNRIAHGIKSGRHKLTRKDVFWIRLQKHKISARQLGETFNVSTSQIYMIWNRRSWTRL